MKKSLPICEISALCRGDTVLIHSSYKSLGNIEGGAATFFDAVTSYLGEDGTLILPAFSYDTVTRTNPYFNLKETPSCIGYLPEFFRTNVAGVCRSLHATHSLCAKGKLARELTEDHETDITPVGENSPLRKMLAYGAKMLFIGCSTNHTTLMHGCEEIADPPYWLNREKTVLYSLDDGNGNNINVESYRHGFIVDGKHVSQCYSKIEELLCQSEIKKGKLLDADTTLMDANAVWSKGIAKMQKDPWYFVKIK